MDYIKCIRSVIVWSVFFLLMTALAPNQVRADMVNWNTSFGLQSESGRIKMMVALNPQPEPPLPLAQLIMEDSKHPLIKVPSDNPHFQILFALYDSQLPVFFIAPGTPDENGHF